MQVKSWICLIIIIVCVILSLFNKKIRCNLLFSEFLKIFKNNRTGKISFFDVICFFIFPLIIAICLVVGFDYSFSKDIANVLLTVFSITFTLLFGVMSILSVTLDSDDKIKKQISREAFTAVSFSMLSSLISLVLLIIYLVLKDYEIVNDYDMNVIIFEVMTGTITFLTLNMIMLFFMVIKRSYVTSMIEKKDD